MRFKPDGILNHYTTVPFLPVLPMKCFLFSVQLLQPLPRAPEGGLEIELAVGLLIVWGFGRLTKSIFKKRKF